jgi:hypothetical protein
LPFRFSHNPISRDYYFFLSPTCPYPSTLQSNCVILRFQIQPVLPCPQPIFMGLLPIVLSHSTCTGPISHAPCSLVLSLSQVWEISLPQGFVLHILLVIKVSGHCLTVTFEFPIGGLYPKVWELPSLASSQYLFLVKFPIVILVFFMNM